MTTGSGIEVILILYYYYYNNNNFRVHGVSITDGRDL
jgi:hypothetical protein